MIHPLLARRMLGLHGLAIVATVAAVLLGVWQYDAWQSGRIDQAAARVHSAAKPLGSVITSDEAFPGNAVGQPVNLTGRWLPGSTIYVADQQLRHRTGVWAVTPLAVCRAASTASCARAPAMLVVRGWAATVSDAPPAPTGPVRVTGWLQPGEGSGVADPDPADDVIPEMRVADAVQHVRQDLYDGYVIVKRALPSTEAPGLEPVTPAALPKAATFTSVRNLLYAIEWWVFGGFAVFLWWRWCRDEVTRVTGVASQT